MTSKTMQDLGHISVSQFCDAHGISRETFYQWRKDGKAPRLEREGIPQRELTRWLAQLVMDRGRYQMPDLQRPQVAGSWIEDPREREAHQAVGGLVATLEEHAYDNVVHMMEMEIAALITANLKERGFTPLEAMRRAIEVVAQARKQRESRWVKDEGEEM